jgi:hypothetical protein
VLGLPREVQVRGRAQVELASAVVELAARLAWQRQVQELPPPLGQEQAWGEVGLDCARGWLPEGGCCPEEQKERLRPARWQP